MGEEEKTTQTLLSLKVSLFMFSMQNYNISGNLILKISVMKIGSYYKTYLSYCLILLSLTSNMAREMDWRRKEKRLLE